MHNQLTTQGGSVTSCIFVSVVWRVVGWTKCPCIKAASSTAKHCLYKYRVHQNENAITHVHITLLVYPSVAAVQSKSIDRTTSVCRPFCSNPLLHASKGTRRRWLPCSAWRWRQPQSQVNIGVPPAGKALRKHVTLRDTIIRMEPRRYCAGEFTGRIRRGADAFVRTPVLLQSLTPAGVMFYRRSVV